MDRGHVGRLRGERDAHLRLSARPPQEHHQLTRDFVRERGTAVLLDPRERQDEVRVANARGSFLAVAQVTDRVRPGVVASPKGRWPRGARDGATMNATANERDSDMGGGAV